MTALMQGRLRRYTKTETYWRTAVAQGSSQASSQRAGKAKETRSEGLNQGSSDPGTQTRCTSQPKREVPEHPTFLVRFNSFFEFHRIDDGHHDRPPHAFPALQPAVVVEPQFCHPRIPTSAETFNFSDIFVGYLAPRASVSALACPQMGG